MKPFLDDKRGCSYVKVHYVVIIPCRPLTYVALATRRKLNCAEDQLQTYAYTQARTSLCISLANGQRRNPRPVLTHRFDATKPLSCRMERC